MQYQYSASNQYWKNATKTVMLLAVKQTVWLNSQKFLNQNLPTHIALVFSNLQIMQYQYCASNQF
jgi:hypothetical protein